MRLLSPTLLAIAIACLSGCDEVNTTELLNKGTVTAVQACLKKFDGSVLSPISAKDACIRKHEAKLGPWASYSATGSLQNAAYTESSDFYRVEFQNRLTDYVITRVEVTLSREGAAGADHTSGSSDTLWVEPFKSSHAVIRTGKSVVPIVGGEWVYGWNFSAIYGIEISP